MSKHGKSVVMSAMILSAAVSGVAMAADEPAAAAAPTGPTLTDILTNSGITATGFVAASYYHSNGYSDGHQFDNKHDSFQLDQAGITFAFQPKEGFGALVDLRAGEDMKILNAAEGNTPHTFDVVQGFVQYASGPVTVIAGKFVTLAGAEVIAPTGNTNFSRSFLFFAEPLTHTGIRGTYAVTDTFNVIAGVNNGWNYSSLTTSGSKTGELGAAWTPNKIFALTAQAYVGKDPIFDAQRTLIDAVATYNMTEALSLVLTYDWGKQKQQIAGAGDFSWNGAAFYVNYALSDQWRVSLRVEYLDDKAGFITGTGVGQTLKEGTLTFGYSPVKSFEVRIEGRYDKSTQPYFRRAAIYAPNSNVVTGYEPSDSQTGFALQGVYKF